MKVFWHSLIDSTSLPLQQIKMKAAILCCIWYVFFLMLFVALELIEFGGYMLRTLSLIRVWECDSE